MSQSLQRPQVVSATRLDMRYLCRALIKYQASDLHVRVGRPPLYRINGRLIPAKMEELSEQQVKSIVFDILTERQKIDLEQKRQVDLSFGVDDIGRFRCNVYFQKGQVSAAVRMIPLEIPQLDDLGVPQVVKELCRRPRGLLLVTGATGSGKSTTLAAMIQYINETTHSHILAIEDPIEFSFRDIKSTITQREVGSDVHSLEEGLHGGLRQDPDVIMIGELRDKEMIELALTAAETGHLVISSLHTNDAKSTIDRIVDVFNGDAKSQVRIQLAATLVGVISQQLLPKADGTGRVCVCEVMLNSPTITSCILRDELDRIPEAIANSSDYYKMQTLNQALEKLVVAQVITIEEALQASSNPDDLKLRMSGVVREQNFDK